jgi:hypothetical protein
MLMGKYGQISEVPDGASQNLAQVIRGQAAAHDAVIDQLVRSEDGATAGMTGV